MKRHLAILAIAGALVILVVTATVDTVGAVGHTPGQKIPTLVASSMDGRDLFEFYCANCHGRDGKGHGPIAVTLANPPADLTVIAAANGGVFPSEAVREMIVGARELAPAHRDQGMPVWGPIFSGLDPNETRNKIRVLNIVAYIASIQAK